jgi:hypothetical protein
MKPWNKCDVCGKFFPYKDLESGDAECVMVTPDSDVSYEEWRILCKTHVKKEQK